MRIQFLETAQAELDEAIIYYNQQRLGLVTNFSMKLWGR